jgi:hypothetical protein
MWLFKLIIPVRDSNCDYLPWEPKNQAMPLVPILSQINPITVHPPFLFMIHFNAILMLCVYIFQVVFSLQFSNQNVVFTFNTVLFV